MFGNLNLAEIIVRIVAILPALAISLPFHELAHAWTAVQLGDDTPRLSGRLSLNPLAHLDPIGTLMIIFTQIAGVGMGWAKPVPINPFNFRNHKLGLVLVSAAGPFANFLLALVGAIPFRLGLVSGYYQEVGILGLVQSLLFIFIETNLALMLFNLIPLGPLDGAKILRGVAPREWESVLVQLEQYGTFVLLAIVFLGGSILSFIINRPLMLLLGAILGQ
jgi:Zn-dependent protease